MRPFIRFAALLPLTVAACLVFGPAQAAEDDTAHPAASVPLDNAYLFLDKMMDKYHAGSTLRLVQSYVSTPKLQLDNVAFTYDNALVLLAYLARGTPDDMVRARVIGDAFILLQSQAPVPDGRVLNSYNVSSAGKIGKDDNGADLGNVAWAGLALAQLYRKTNDAKYLDAATSIADWAVKNTYTTKGFGGFLGGWTAKRTAIKWSSAEYNIDVNALFTILDASGAAAPAGHTWAQLEAACSDYVQLHMWNAAGKYYWTGADTSNSVVNKSLLPEDVQSWGYLAMPNAHSAASLTWSTTALKGAGPYAGLSFSASDTSGVWFEGTAQTALALKRRNQTGDATLVAQYLASIESAQVNGPHADGQGIIAASKDGLLTGDGSDKYFSALHIGATAWYVLAKQNKNPFAPM